METESDSDSWESVSSDSDAESITNKLMDIRSRHFCPKLALRCTNMRPPVPNSPICFNLTHFEKVVPSFSKPMTSPKKGKSSKLNAKPGNATSSAPQRRGISSNASTVQVVKPPEPASASTTRPAEAPFYPIPGRKFLPHQLPVYRPRKQQPNVLTLMETMGGPFSALNTARLNRNRIKVWIRNPGGFRGYCIGTLLAFDKSWNLVLRDVDEVFQRKRKVKFPAVPINLNEGEVLAQERESFRTGELVSTYSKSGGNKNTGSGTTKVERGVRTDFLVESSDALNLCRLGVKSLAIHGGKSATATSSIGKKNGSSNSQTRKKRLVILAQPSTDFHGNRVVAQSKMYEIVERHVPQLMLLGDSIVFVETQPRY